MSEKVVPHEPITRELLYEWGYIRSGEYLLNWNGIYVIENGDKWDYGSPGHYTIDEEHPFVKHGECTYLDELNDYQVKRSGRGLKHYNEQMRHDYYDKYGKNYQTIWDRIKSLLCLKS